MKDLVSGLTRGFALFLGERHDYVVTASLPGVTARKHD